MYCGSLFGWDVPAASSDHMREAIAERNAIITISNERRRQ
jgi:hypothetical protein